jgi:hypothetical protein
MITNLVTYRDFITTLFTFQGQADAIYFELNSAFDLVPYTPLFLNLLVLLDLLVVTLTVSVVT